MSALTLFPIRIPVGRIRPDDLQAALDGRRDIAVVMTPEFERALASLFQRVGGDNALTNEELAEILALESVPIGNGAQVQRIEYLEREVHTLRSQVAVAADLRRRIDDLERLLVMGERPTDWEHPGQIGAAARNSGKFTTIDANTGVTLNPSTPGSMDNVTIGATTQRVGRFLAFGCNGSAAQTAFASGGAVATTGATNTTPFGYTTAAQANAIVTLVNNIRTALVNNGIMS